MPTSTFNTGYSSRLQGFQTLMPFRVREVLLVASRYDSFILEEEGLLTDLILQEYDRLNLRYAPRINSTPSTRDALGTLDSDRRMDLVIVTMHPGDMDPADFAREAKRRHPRLPVVLLGYDNRELQDLLNSEDASAFDHIFVWTGDARILLAMVSAIEDEHNVEHDVKTVGVEVILLIDDSVHFVSAVLPILYGKLMKQSQRLISEGITLSHKVLRMRARPKVLLARSYEEAWAHFECYRANILGIISDVRFHHRGRVDPVAGVEFARRVQEEQPDVPVLLQSTEASNERWARSLGVSFVHKDSPHLKQSIREFMRDCFGFGPFVFRRPDGTRVAEANNLQELRHCLTTIPDDCLVFHAERNHFSTWLKARTEFRLAKKIRPRRPSEFASASELRHLIIEALDTFRRESHRDAIADFSPDTFGSISTFSRIGGGSLGGKARGLAFLNALLRECRIGQSQPGVQVLVPPTVVIGTEIFDAFMEENSLVEIAESGADDEEIREVFVRAALPGPLIRSLSDLVRIVPYPVAVRSSSLLEDSQHQPFAGVYETYMLANSAPAAEDRLEDLCTAIKLVYASTFSAKAHAYLRATPVRPEKEKMAVIIQKLIGRRHGDRFYPSFSGVAQSYNYYPFGRVQPQDGAARVALGLGKFVVEGRGGVRFCPKYPRHLPEFSSVEDTLKNAQKEFDALPLTPRPAKPHVRYQPQRYEISEAMSERTMRLVGSVYSPEDHAVHDGASRSGMPLVTFAGILKHREFPLSEVLIDLLQHSHDALSTPVEIEFAVDLEAPPRAPRTFACLQIRPLTVLRELSRVDLNAIEAEHLLCQSPRALGHGRIRGIRDVVCVVPEHFDRKHSARTAADVAELNARLAREESPYLLIGPGRWGSADPWLGIPVNWGQIAGARIIVETGFAGLTVTPSEGSHFFHNMTAFQVGYMTMNPDRGEGLIDWEWLLDHEPERSGENGLRWIRLPEPILGLIDGHTRTGVIVKTSADVAG